MSKEKNNTNKKIIIVSVIAVILIIAAIAVFVPKSDKNVNTESNKNSVSEATSKKDSAVSEEAEAPEKDNNAKKNNKAAEKKGTADDEAVPEELEEALAEIEEQFPDEIEAVQTEIKPDVDYKKGTVTDTTYESEFVGVKYTAPEGWEIVSQQELDAMEAQTGTACELQAYNPADGSSVNIILEKLPADTITEEMYINSIVNSVEKAAEFDVENISDSETYELAGQTYKVLSFTVSQNDVVYYQKYYVRQKGEYMIVVSAVSQSEDVVNSGIADNFMKY